MHNKEKYEKTIMSALSYFCVVSHGVHDCICGCIF